MKKLHNRISAGLFEMVSVAISSVFVITIVFTFLFRLVGVDGTSMVPTLQHQDWLVASTATGEYEYKDIVIVVQPWVYNEPIVKRVIATEGQWIDVDYETGVVFVGDTKDTMTAIAEDYIAEPATDHNYDDIHEYPVQVPENCLFVMGDNRNNSTDSRSFLVGFIDERYVLGKAICRVFSGEKGFDLRSVEIYN